MSARRGRKAVPSPSLMPARQARDVQLKYYLALDALCIGAGSRESVATLLGVVHTAYRLREFIGVADAQGFRAAENALLACLDRLECTASPEPAATLQASEKAAVAPVLRCFDGLLEHVPMPLYLDALLAAIACLDAQLPSPIPPAAAEPSAPLPSTSSAAAHWSPR
ncbi:hypothetical protein [Burkholderia gladioli]|uniref:hypothetical protein n=1 Tax=Burkholderia gladioli TaxID=28095 RepID=UPI000F8013C2|nr:hypothetical protein [Burkholderia gladioli]MBU9321199.1 hypothetical protein [Burkholderia gladioli]MDN7813642.1 hypothetical protein [Burkholderia gladioli]